MPEDRDHLFEQALARHLRTGGAAESGCLDPEILAAFHECTLSPEEVSYAKSHLISCARCQSVLAQLEATEAVNELHEAAQADVHDLAAASIAKQVPHVARTSKSLTTAGALSKVVAIPPKKHSSLRWVAPAGAVAAGLLIWISFRESRINIKPAAPAPAQVAENREQAVPRSDDENLKDLIPSKELEKQKSTAPSTDQLNERAPIAHAAPAPQPSLRDEKKDAAIGGKLESENNKPSSRYEYSARAGTAMGGGRGPSAAAAQAQANNALQRGDQGVVGGAAQMTDRSPAPPDLDKAELKKAAPPAKSGIVGALQPAAPPPPPAPKRLSARLRGTVTDPSGAVVAGANVVLKSANGDTVVSTSTDASGTYSFSAVAAGNYQLELQSAGFKTDRLTGLTVAAGENVMNARLELGTSTETVQVAAQAPVISSSTSQLAEVTEARERKAGNLQTLLLLSPGLQTATSPDGKAVWKFGEAGQIFRSTNAGKDWTSAVSGVAVKLLAGSAPSAKICWIAGASGTLLRTTDGGKHWQRITIPISGDLGGVHASDAKHASIWDAPNRVSYETSDGGATWKQSANE
jgi:Carboxypeptidase regulatory-like domain